MKKVLITSRSFGQVSEDALTMLKDGGFEVEFYNEVFAEEEFRSRLSGSDALIIGAHPLTRKAMEGAPRLKIVSKHGAGLDNIDLEWAQKCGIKVTNVPAVNANAVADLTFSLILDVARKTSMAARNVREGVWSKTVGVDVYAKNLSLIGFGEIGKKVAKRAIGFSMKLFVYDPFIKELPDEFRKDARLVSFEEALAQADFLSVHVPLNDQTRGLISDGALRAMKRGSFLINTSRGGIVDEQALAEAIGKGHIAGAGLDVLEEEPVRKENPLIRFEQVTVTPHIGMYSFEAINKVSLIAARNVIDHFSVV